MARGKYAQKKARLSKPSNVRWDLDLAPGSWLPLGHSQAPPQMSEATRAKFGSPRFTPEQQAANPAKQMTRVVKDVIRVGEWKTGWNADGTPQKTRFTPEMLSLAERNFNTLTAEGVAFNLGNTHGDDKTGLIHPNDLIAPLDQVAFDGTTFWISSYVTPAEAERLQRPVSKVSPSIWPEWVDGRGRKFQYVLGHVAVTDHPVIPGQGPFLALANSQGGNSMDFAALLELINQMLPDGVDLPEDTDESNLIERLSLVLNTLNPGAAAEEAPADEAPVLDESAMPAEVQMALKPFQAQVANLANQLKSVKAEQTQGKKNAYVAKLNALNAAGNIDGTTRLQMMAEGHLSDWRLSLLQPFERTKMVNLSNTAKQHATGKAPAINPQARTEADIRADLEKRGIPVAEFV